MTKRYIIVKYPDAVSSKMSVNESGLFSNHLPIHELLGSYHWARLDSDHVLVSGEFPLGHSIRLKEHSDVLILPHLASSRTLSEHGEKMNKVEHINSLVGHFAFAGISHSSTMSDIIEDLENKFGPVFAA